MELLFVKLDFKEFGGASDIIVPNRSKQKRPRPQSSTQEEDEVDVKLSKRAKKKIEQLKVRKLLDGF